MVKLYLKKIKDGTITLADVPKKWYDAVAAALEAEGWSEENRNQL